MVRTEVRNCFLSKFFEALDIVLSRLDSIVLEAPSSLGRNYDSKSGKGSHGACIACDRPLRTRVPKSYKTTFSDKQNISSVPLSSKLNMLEHRGGKSNVESKSRPYSAGPNRQSKEQCRGGIDANLPGFVKRGGFKSRLSESMSQEKLVEDLIASFPKDVSFPVSSGDNMSISRALDSLPPSATS
jgi:hypothetical protein